MECMGWAGTGLLWTVSGGLAASVTLDQALAATAPKTKPFTFLQISDSHIGFNKDPNPDARVTFREAVARIAALPTRPDFILHTGDITQLSKPAEFDDADQILKEAGLDVFHVPGEHDMLDEGQGKAYLDRYGKGTEGDGWYSFDTHGVHFIALVNTLSLEKLGHLGADQIDFVRRDVAGLPADTPIVVFSHIPLFAMYPQWGWATDDSLQVLNLLKRFASVTALNGHVHQLFTRVEGNVTFHSATTTAYPLPKPGQAPAPTPQVLPARQLHTALGIRTVEYRRSTTPLAITDQELT
jgi:3',5'-cyclic AMP phosphodiesterase CpdA